MDQVVAGSNPAIHLKVISYGICSRGILNSKASLYVVASETGSKMVKITAEQLKLDAEARGEDPSALLVGYNPDGKIGLFTDYPDATHIFVDHLSVLLERNKHGQLPRELDGNEMIQDQWYNMRDEVREQFPV